MRMLCNFLIFGGGAALKLSANVEDEVEESVRIGSLLWLCRSLCSVRIHSAEWDAKWDPSESGVGAERGN